MSGLILAVVALGFVLCAICAPRGRPRTPTDAGSRRRILAELERKGRRPT